MNKTQIRKKFLEQRRALSSEEQAEKSKKIAECLLSSEIELRERIVHIYIQGKDGEADAEYLLPFLLENAKDVFTSKTNLKERTLTHHSLKDYKSSLENIDIVIVPGLAFGKNGHRVGYGYGFYDRFLAEHPKALKIALGYEWQIMDKLPFEDHDVKLDYICTEKMLYKMS